MRRLTIVEGKIDIHPEFDPFTPRPGALGNTYPPFHTCPSQFSVPLCLSLPQPLYPHRYWQRGHPSPRFPRHAVDNIGI